jgi:hypothetical protein
MNAGKYLLVLLCILAMPSCKKDKEDEVVKDFTMEALTTKSWRPALVDGNTSVNPPVGTYQYYAVQNWDKDDVITYKTDKVYYNYGSAVAPVGVETPASRVYSVDLPKKTITIGGLTYQLLELSAVRLKYSLALGGGNPTLIFLFEHP